jgi:biotin-dependent carboxylase-like uncharacterized protein
MNAALRVLDPGGLTTVQDLGRPGLGASGVPPGGAADAVSLRVGNRLVGNADTDAALEMTLTGGAFALDAPALLCLAGAGAPDAAIETDGVRRPLRRWTPTVVSAGASVRIGRLAGGARAYLCVGGSVRTEPMLGSRSTLPAVRLGDGLGAAPLRAGDAVPIGGAAPGLRVGALSPTVARALDHAIGRRTLRVLPGAHADAFGADARGALARTEFRVDPRSDRSGVRLGGAGLPGEAAALEKSEGAVPGTVQVPPSGAPIVLGVDGPTVGGYPAIASVIGADLPALGQCRPGDAVRFAWTDLAGAFAAWRELEALVDLAWRAERGTR